MTDPALTQRALPGGEMLAVLLGVIPPMTWPTPLSSHQLRLPLPPNISEEQAARALLALLARLERSLNKLEQSLIQE